MYQIIHKVDPPDSVTAAEWMLRTILESMQDECEIFARPWTSMSCEYRGSHSDEGLSQRYVKFSLVFQNDPIGRRTVCASGTVYREGEDGKWYRGEFSVALSGATFPKEYECKLTPWGQYESREAVLKT